MNGTIIKIITLPTVLALEIGLRSYDYYNWKAHKITLPNPGP